MRTHSLLALLLSLAGCSGGRGASGSNEAPISPVPIHFTSPHYNDVFMKATHNAYWIEYSNGPSVDPWASGTRQRILDQLLHERVRSFELDLHRDGGHTGHFSIYHTSVTDNSTVADLENALELFKRFDYLQPDHEPVTIVLEAKEMSTGDSRLFESGWRPEDLDRTLWDYLGPRLYTPAEFMSRCPGAPNLTACAAQVGWPTMDELRGRTLVTILGNWGNNYWDWYDYAARDPHTMGAFPMR
ncbi:MAG: hypothetical protein ACXVDD_04950 [Polyangia bacterium]